MAKPTEAEHEESRLGERLERTLYDLLETLIQAKYTRDRTPLLEEANLKLEILRFQVRLAKDFQCLRTALCAGLPTPHSF